MSEYTSNSVRNHSKFGNRSMSIYNHSEQARELRELQRSLTERIRRMQLGASCHPRESA